MKKSNFKKTVALMSATIMCFSVSNGFAANNEISTATDSSIISPFNIAITLTRNNLSLGSLGKLTCYGETQVQNGYNAGVIVELQQYNGGWNTIKTWSGSDSDFIMLENYWYVTKGYSYRLKLTHIAYNGNWVQIESFNKYSNIVNYN